MNKHTAHFPCQMYCMNTMSPWFLWLLRCVQYSRILQRFVHFDFNCASACTIFTKAGPRSVMSSFASRARCADIASWTTPTLQNVVQKSAKQESLILLQILSRTHRSKNIKNQNNDIQTTRGVGPTPRNWGANMRNDRCCSKLIPTGERWWSLGWA